MPTFDTPEPITADIQIYVGQVRVRAADRTDTVVEVSPSDPSNEASVQAAERTTVDFSGGRLVVRAPKPKGLAYVLPWRGNVDITVDLPTGSRLDAAIAAELVTTGRLGQTTVRSSYDDLRLEETGALEAKASSGDISVERAAGPVDMTTSVGAIRVGSIEGPGSVKTSTGAITIGEVGGDVQLKSATGEITVDRVRGDLTVRSAHGRIRVDAATSGTLRLENASGKIGVGIAEGTAAWLDLHSKNGIVRNALSAADAPEDADSVVEVHAQTSYGDIEIHRS